MYTVDIKEKFVEYKQKNENSPNTISEYIDKILLPYGEDTFYEDECGFEYTAYDYTWVIIVTHYHTYKVQRKRLSTYTDYDNDCLAIRINKGVYEYIRIEDLVAIEYERGYY